MVVTLLNEAKESGDARWVSGFPQTGFAEIRGLVTDLFFSHRGLILALLSSALRLNG